MTVERIVSQFNEAVKKLNSAIDHSLGGNIPSSQIDLSNSAISIYSCLEWIIKYYLHQKFTNPKKNSNEIQIAEKPNFKLKFKLFEKTVSPTFSNASIDGNKITSLRQMVRNDVEHSAFVPPFNSLTEVVEETRKIILNYIDIHANLTEVNTSDKTLIDIFSNWTEFYVKCDGFDKYRNYVLVLGTNKISPDKMRYISKLDFSLIIDFNSSTETSGFFKIFNEENSSRRQIYLLTSDDIVTFSNVGACYYLCPIGLDGRINTQISSPQDWHRKKSAFSQNFFKNYFAAFNKPTNIIALWDDEKYLLKLYDYVDPYAGDLAKWIFAIENPLKINSLHNNANTESVTISPAQIADGISKFKSLYRDVNLEAVTLPAKDDEFATVEAKDFSWIEEDFKILHREIVTAQETGQEDSNSVKAFYRGGRLSWSGLNLHYDVDREKFPVLRKKVEKILKERAHQKFVLQHYPGIGGTTLGLRLAWDLKNDYPTLIVKKLRPLETISKAVKIFDITKKPLLFIADGADVNADEVDKFRDELLGRQVPFCILLIKRGESQSLGDVNIDDCLTDLEFASIISKYKALVPERKRDFDIISSTNERKYRHPFYLGLIGFEEDFQGLETFVSKNIRNATPIQKQIISIICFNYYFGQIETSAQMFCILLNLPENSVIRLNEHLTPDIATLFINTSEVLWKPLHYLVAQRILIDIGTEKGSDWKIQLPDLSIKIIELISEKSSVPSDAEQELLKRLFVYRDSREILGREEETQFSVLIEAYFPNEHAGLRVLKKLTESFRNESHFWAHLARFYSLKMGDHNNALLAITEAINLNDTDPLLYHMKGMCLRKLVREKFDQYRGRNKISSDTIVELRAEIDTASAAFEKSRTLNKSDEYAYVSDIQLLISVIDFFFSISNYSTRVEFLRNLNPWLREKLENAEELLDEIKFKTYLKDKNSFVEECDIKLQALYENYSIVIEGWNNLLSKNPEGKGAIRRSLIHAYIRRAAGWGNLEIRDLAKILRLAEENLIEDSSKNSNILLWFRAARQSSTIDINNTIEKISNWRTISDSDDATYYLGILHCIQAIAGISISKIQAEKLVRELSEKKRNVPYRTHCFEWYGKRPALGRLVASEDGVKRNNDGEMIFNSDLLEKTIGKISFIKGPEAGTIELKCGLLASFIPARNNFVKGKDINTNVKFYLGFSYDGLRAFDVVEAENH